MAQVFLDPNDSWTIVNDNAQVFGADGDEQVIINSGAEGIVLDQNVERLDLAGDVADFTFQQQGNQLLVFDGATLIATLPVAADGTDVVFFDGLVDVAFNGNVLEIGGTPVPSDAPAAVVPGAIDPGTTSDADGGAADPDAPVVANANLAVDEDAAEGDLVGTMNAVDPNGDAIAAFNIVSGNDDGYFAVDNAGNITLTAAGAAAIDFESGDVIFTLGITATDVNGDTSSEATATIQLIDVDDTPPDPQDITDSTVAGVPVDVDVLTGHTPDVDTDNADLVVTLVPDSEVNGTVVDNGDGTFTVTPDGLDDVTFDYNVADGNGDADATVTVNVTNNAPTADDVVASGPAGQPLEVDVVINDVDGQTLEIVAGGFSGNNNGTLEKVDEDTFVYTPNNGYVGTETVTFTVTDGFATSTATAEITIETVTGGTDGDDILGGGTGAEQINGLAGDDTINGGGGADTITGGTGDDRIHFNNDAVQIAGGVGNDTLVVTTGNNIGFDLNGTGATNGSDQYVGFGGSTGGDLAITNPVVSGFENIDGSNAQVALTVIDNSANNLLQTGVDNDTITATNGGQDTVNSGAGDDVIVITDPANAQVDGGDGTDLLVITGTGTVNDTALGNVANVENAVFSSATKVTLGVNAGKAGITQAIFSNAVTLNASGMTVPLTVGVGTTTNNLALGSGDDTIVMPAGVLSAGNETVDGGLGNDTLLVTGTATGLSSIADTNFANVTTVETLSFTATAAVSLSANAEAAGIATVVGAPTAPLSLSFAGYTSVGVTVTSGSQSDKIVLGQGDDVVDSGAGSDTIVATVGTSGNDSISAGAGDDLIVFDTAELTGDDSIDGGADTAGDSLSIKNTAALTDADFANVANIEILKLAAGGAVSLGANAQAAGFTAVTATATAATITATAITLPLNVGLTASSNNVALGTGDDTIVLPIAKLTLNQDIDGGAGDDKIIATGGGNLTDGKFAGVTDVETLELTATATVALATNAESAGINNVIGDATNALSLSIAGYTSVGVTVTSGSQSDTIVLGQGDDVVDSGAGSDTIVATVGTSGNDSISAGAGDDLIVFDTAELTGDDSIDGGADTAGDSLSITNAAALTDADFANVANIEILNLAAGGAVSLGTNAQAAGFTNLAATSAGVPVAVTATAMTAGLNITLAASGNNLDLGSGDDVITIPVASLAGGPETVDGGDGTDAIVVSGAATGGNTLADGDFTDITNVETLTFTATATVALATAAELGGIVAVNGATNAALDLDASAYTGESLTVTSGSQADTIVTGDGNDTVDGGAGADSITGGIGQDNLTGGAGADEFSYVRESHFGDTITDFSTAEGDAIQIDVQNQYTASVKTTGTYSATGIFGSAYEITTSAGGHITHVKLSLLTDAGGQSSVSIAVPTGGGTALTHTTKTLANTTFLFTFSGTGTAAFEQAITSVAATGQAKGQYVAFGLSTATGKLYVAHINNNTAPTSITANEINQIKTIANLGAAVNAVDIVLL